MSISKLITQINNKSTQITNPSFKDVVAAINMLDGDSCTLVCLESDISEDAHMSIGGGNNGKYIVYYTLDNLEFMNLLDHEILNEEKNITLVAGGQEADFPNYRCTDLQKAVAAAKYYFEHETSNPSLKWEKE